MSTPNRSGRQVLSAENMKYFAELCADKPCPGFVTNTVFYSRVDSIHRSDLQHQQPQHTLQVINGDSINVALQYLDSRPVVLNMASEKRPGGGFLSGASAQEEALCRRSALYLSIADPFNADENRSWKYPIPTFGAIYSPDVPIIRNQQNAFVPAEDQVKLCFVSVPGVRRPKLVNNGTALDPKNAKIAEEKIRNILRVCYFHQHKTIVLGALGCGAFCNPPQHIALLFRNVLKEPEFQGIFDRVVFAILDIAKTSNFKVFNDILINGIDVEIPQDDSTEQLELEKQQKRHERKERKARENVESAELSSEVFELHLHDESE
jgi:uncharacterized protein (TIGR02452 family)